MFGVCYVISDPSGWLREDFVEKTMTCHLTLSLLKHHQCLTFLLLAALLARKELHASQFDGIFYNWQQASESQISSLNRNVRTRIISSNLRDATYDADTSILLVMYRFCTSNEHDINLALIILYLILENEYVNVSLPFTGQKMST